MNTPLKKSRIIFFAFALFFGLTMSCENTNDIVESTKTTSPVLDYIKSLGFKESDIEDLGSKYRVEGDIIFSKDMVLPNRKKSHGGRSEQFYNPSLIYFSNQNNIRIGIDPSMTEPPDMTGEINAAINQWNNINNSRITFTVVAGNADILIRDAFLGNFVCGQAPLASNGLPGNFIEINKALIAANPFDQRQRTIAHELGHTIGFVHTNWQTGGGGLPGIDVPNVPGADATSLMNGGECGIGATLLSANDQAATISLYPNIVSSLVYNSSYPFTITWDPGVKQNFITQYDIEYTFTSSRLGLLTGLGFSATPSFTFPFGAGAYNGSPITTRIRTRYADGTISGWVSLSGSIP
jgi:Dual-action HEIGH metallo-peptidase